MGSTSTPTAGLWPLCPDPIGIVHSGLVPSRSMSTFSDRQASPRRASLPSPMLHERDGLTESGELVRHRSRFLGEPAIQLEGPAHRTSRAACRTDTEASGSARLPPSPIPPAKNARAQSHGSRRGIWALGSRVLDDRARDRLIDPTAGLYIGESSRRTVAPLLWARLPPAGG